MTESAPSSSSMPLPPLATDNIKGMVFMLISTVGFAAMVMLVRAASTDLHPFEIAFFRNLFGLLVLVPWFIKDGWMPFKTSRLGVHVIRNLVQVTTVLSFFFALAITPLALATALSFIAPIFATILAILFFREMVGVRRWMAILFGFAGTYVILRPGFTPISLGPLLVIFSSVMFAISLTIMKLLSRTDSTVTITCYSASLLAVFSLGPAAYFWQWPTWEQLGLLVALGLIATSAQMFFIQAMKIADMNVVMPMFFFQLIWVAVGAYLIFGEAPDAYTLLGGAMVFASTFYIAFRERAIKADPAAQPPDGG
jgi:drug/metabolite transporter (DMT)-like permease